MSARMIPTSASASQRRSVKKNVATAKRMRKIRNSREFGMSACGIFIGAEAECFFAPSDLDMTSPSFLKNSCF